MKNALSYLARWLFILAVTSSIGFIAVHFGRQTAWYKNHLYHRLLTGDSDQRLRAATMLALVGAEKQLLKGLKNAEPGVHDSARRGLEYLWFTSSGKEAFRLMEEACRAADQEDFKEALRILDQITTRYPDYAEGWNRRASIFWQTGRSEQALADCRRALSLNPNHYGAWQGMGVCHLQLGDVTAACESLRRALAIFPHDESAQRSLRRCEEFMRSHPPTGSRPSRGELL